MDAIYLTKIVHVVYTSMTNRPLVSLTSRQIEEFTRIRLVRLSLIIIHRFVKRFSSFITILFVPFTFTSVKKFFNSLNPPKNDKKISSPLVSIIIHLCRQFARPFPSYEAQEIIPPLSDSPVAEAIRNPR